ncbi:hypothetical protein ASC76_23900 [Rhizobacter sp. Root404]|nr:hypothetical protein ASC76_23900 [Rhizobacter sp. Root404]
MFGRQTSNGTLAVPSSMQGRGHTARKSLMAVRDRISNWVKPNGERAPVQAPERLAPPSFRPSGYRSAGVSAKGDDKFRIVFENSLEGIVVMRPDGRLLSCNDAAARLLGGASGELLGRNLTDWVVTEPSQTVNGVTVFPLGILETVVHRGGAGKVPVEVSASLIEGGGHPCLLVILRDITERKAAQDRLSFLANYDSLTGLPNRALFRDRLSLAMRRAERSGVPVALMFLDLDRFKVVNDSLGHAAGDLLLQHVSTKLANCVRKVDSVARNVDSETVTVSRLGGDEFTIIFEAIRGPEDAALVAQRILDSLLEPCLIDGQEIFISCSIGISLYPRGECDLDGLIRQTDMAMYRSKTHGGGMYSFYSLEMSAAVEARLQTEASLRHALQRNEFTLHYQPKADLLTGRVTGVEALLRWCRPEEGMVPPDRFISMLEDTGLILPVGAWVIRTACAELARWDSIGMPPLAMAVNLSARQFRDNHLKQLIADTLLDSGIAPSRLELELTESQLIEDSDKSRALLDGLAELGVKVAIDDFGTGHSSLSYLKRFSIDTLKIDRSFVRDITNSEEDHAIATAVVALGRSLDLRVVAEGVETLHQADCLRALGCDQIQGYLLSRPLPSDQLVAWLIGYRAKRSFLRGADLASPSAPMPLLSVADMDLD